MAEYFVGPVMEKLIDTCFEYLKDQIRWQTGMKEELQKLRDIHAQIQSVVSAYSQVEIKDPALNRWYWQLRDAIDEADDVLDEFEYWKLEKQVRKSRNIRKVRSLMKSLKKDFVKIGKRALKFDPGLRNLEVAVQKLSKISAEVSTFLHLLDRANQEQQLELRETRETGSMNNNELLGRSEEMEFLTQWLRKPYEMLSIDSYRNISVLSVVGHGGMGKTTLLQHAYEDEMVKEFDVKMWVCVSTNFKAKTVIANILECLKKEKTNLDSLEQLQRSLQSEMMCKRFLLVLDDIWEDDEREWKKVIDPLSYGSSGSKILITTRMDSIALMFAKMIKKREEVLRLKGLEEDECLQLFNTHAFAGVENSDDEFRSIAVKMVEKLSGCPLAVKIIGGILNSYVEKSYWVKVLNTNIGKVGSDQNHLLPILKLSYMHLPNFLQNCFAFCCMFSQDHEFDKDDLIRMWIALDFIQSSNISGETLEDTGRRYFNILVQKSFFEEFLNYRGQICYKMHDLLHELAQFVYAQECFRFVDDRVFSVPKTARHLSIKGISSSREAAFKKMGEFKNLRSLFLSFSDDAEFDENVIYEILKRSKSIRLLAINHPSFEYNMPKNIGCLIHLRYLKVERFGCLKLQRSISDLYHLQFIISSRLPDIEMDNIGWKELMPNENCQLIMEPLTRISSYRFLRIEGKDELVSFATEAVQWLLKYSSSLLELEFDKLQFLQSLPSSLESFSSLTTLKVSNVPQLKLLPNPPASLVTIKLCYLESLQCLQSSWSTFSSLKRLHLRKIPLLKSLPDLPSSLEMLKLKELESLQCLPSSLSVISSLKNLKLINIPLLKSLPDLPSSLEVLGIEELESLQCLPSSLSTIASLTNLELKNIPLLQSLPDLPSSLEDLELIALQCLPSPLSTISSLTNLRLENIPLLKSLSDLPSSLITLYLVDLESLQCQPSSLATFSSLTNLKLKNIPLLQSLPDLPSSLERLELEKLESLKCLPSSLPAISSLDILTLKNIPLLKSLPELPSSLRYLDLENLENMDCLPSCLHTSLQTLWIKKVPLLLELPDLPASFNYLHIRGCDPQLMEAYQNSAYS